MFGGLGSTSLKPLGFIPDPLEKSIHYLDVIAFESLLIAQQIKKAYSFLWTSKRDLEMLVNMIFVMLSFNLRILSSIIALNYAFSKPVMYNFFT